MSKSNYRKVFKELFKGLKGYIIINTILPFISMILYTLITLYPELTMPLFYIIAYCIIGSTFVTIITIPYLLVIVNRGTEQNDLKTTNDEQGGSNGRYK